MSGFFDFLRNGIMMFLGPAFGFFHALFSIIGMLMIFIAALSWGISAIMGAHNRIPITMLIVGVVICGIFGFSFGINYFDIVV
jgi:hypothetical protein